MSAARTDRDTLVGALVMAAAAVLLGLVYSADTSPAAGVEGYTLKARFNRADGIAEGSTVRLSGVPVGKVIAQELDAKFRAVATLAIAPDVKLTSDTAAVIQTDGLLGAKYIELKPGGDERMLAPGEEISYTQDAMVVEELLEMIIQQGRAKRGYLDRPLPGEAKKY